MKNSCRCTSRLSALGVAVAFGITSALCMMFMAWSVVWWGHGGELMKLYAEMFPGYEATMTGGWIGGAWGFGEGFVFGLIFAWIYNLCVCCCKCKCCKSVEVCEPMPPTPKL